MKPYIEFPHLGIKLFIDRVAFHIGAKPIYWYGIIIACGLVIAAAAAVRLGKRNGVSSDTILDIVLWGIPSGIICARLYYVIFSFDDYRDNLIDIFKIWNGGIAIYGAVIGAVASTLIYCKAKKINPLPVMDDCSVGLVIGQMIGRWGNFFNQEAFGGNTNLPWGMTGSEIAEKLRDMSAQGLPVDPSLPVHPTFLYESLWNLAVLGILLWIFYKKRKFDGQIFWSYIVFYGLGRVWIEGLRTDSLYLGPVRISQIVAAACVALGAMMLVRGFKLKRSGTNED